MSLLSKAERCVIEAKRKIRASLHSKTLEIQKRHRPGPNAIARPGPEPIQEQFFETHQNPE